MPDDLTFDAAPVEGTSVTLDVGTTEGTTVTLDAGTVEGTDVTLEAGPVEGTEVTLDAGPVEGTTITFDVGASAPGGGGGVELGETSTTAYRGDRGKTAYDHSQATGNPHGAAVADITGLTSALAAKLDSSDASVTNSRTPTAHATSHKTGGSDALHLDELAAPSGSVALGSQKITGLANGTASTDAAAYGQLAWPRRISISCATSPPNTYTTWTPTFSAVFYGGYSAGATSSGGESWTYYVLLEAGTYSFRLVRRNTSASGKILPTLGGTALTEVDGYAGSNTGDQASTQTGITVAASGLIALVFTNPNKNASSSGYGWTIQGFDLWRTGA